MKYLEEFNTLVDRTGLSTVKQANTPQIIRKSDNISLWGAEFEFPAAPFVVDAVRKWAEKGLYAYTVDDGEFSRIVVNWLQYHRNWTIRKEWIVPVYGITSSLATAMRAFTNEGDGIISMQPGYHMYWHAVELSNRRKVENRLLYDGSSYQIDWEQLEAQMADPGNRMLLVCNPHNPLGRVFDPDEIQRIASLAEKYDVIIFNDEIFAECLYEGVEFRTFDQVSKNDLKVITAISLGKWQSFTGTNQATLIISHDGIRRAFVEERDREFYGSMNPMMLPAYRAAYTAEGEIWLQEFMAYIDGNYQLVKSTFERDIPDFHAVTPQGTFILWVDASEFYRRMNYSNERDFMKFLYYKALFHVDPGSQYGGNAGFFRMNLAVPRAELSKCLNTLKSAVRQTQD